MGWAWARLNHICEINPRTWDTPGAPDEQVSFVPMAAVEAETGILDPTQERSWKDLERKTYTKFHEGDILFAKVTPCMENGKIAVASGLRSGRGLGSTEFHVLRPSTAIVQRYLLLYLLQRSFRAMAERSMTGAVGLRRVPASFLTEHLIPLPPLAEQHRIVETLEDHLSRLDAAQSWLGSTQAKSLHLQSLLYGRTAAGAFSRRVRVDEAPQVDEIRRTSSSRATRRWKPKTTSAIPGYTPPDNWTMASLGDLSYASGYGTSTKCDYNGAGHPVLRIPNVQDGSIDLSDLKRAIDPSLDLTNYSLEPGDLLFVRTNGSRKLIGRVGVVEESLPHAFASYLIRFRLTPGIVEPRWVQLVTQSPLWRQALERYAASSAGQYNLSAETLSHLPVPVPPLAVQRETLEVVSAALDGVTRLSAATELATARGKYLRDALLNRAFTGALVPQDSTDEPASVLLDRIRAERQAQSDGGRGKRAPRRPRKTATADATPPPPPPATSTPAPTNAVQQELPL
ncbi:restriction endonuclease subunit S [Stenotrophomonas sp. NPDC087984]